MLRAEAPCLHDSPARLELDLPAHDAATEQRERVAFAIRDLGRLTGCGAEHGAVGEQLEHLLWRRGDERFLMDGHVAHRTSSACAARRARSAGLPKGLPWPASR